MRFRDFRIVGLRRAREYALLVVSLNAIAAMPAGAADELPQLDVAMYDDPKIETTLITHFFPPELRSLWLEALSRPEADLKRQACDAIVQAHEAGMSGWPDAAERIAGEMARPDQHPVVRHTAARALIALGARQRAPALLEQSKTGSIELAQLIDPVLMQWEYEPARELWLARLDEPDVSPRLLILAMQGLEVLQIGEAADRLLEIAKSPQAGPSVRIEAAKALGGIRTSGLESEARALFNDRSQQPLANRLAAAWMLAEHDGDEARTILSEWSVHREPTIAAVALRRLLQIDPELLMPAIEQTLSSTDNNVRELGARALAALPSELNLRRLAPLLDDPQPAVRQFVRQALTDAASNTDRNGLVRELCMESLAGDAWRAQEQAAILAAELDQKPGADRLVELLDSERPEVYITSAWALRKLAVAATLPAMYSKAQRLAGQIGQPGRLYPGDAQLCQLFQAFGQMKYKEADPLLQRYISRGARGIESRTAAVWALGLLYEDNLDGDLARKFYERLTDTDSVPPEDSRVRRMAAIGLGRMKAEPYLGALRSYASWRDTPEAACLWALHRITGEPMPEREVGEQRVTGWFVEPIPN